MTPSRRKEFGRFYTPVDLANRLVRGTRALRADSILDPACGDGALLAAARARWGEDINFYGFDVQPKALSSYVRAKTIDFLEVPPNQKFDLILTNPPFVRHHLLSNAQLTRYREAVKPLIKFDGRTDLWAYFLAKSCMHVENGGSLAAILPWSFFQADYSTSIRSLLADRFGSIRVEVLGNESFDGANPRVLFLWCADYGRTCKSINIRLPALSDGASPKELTMGASKWITQDMSRLLSGDAASLIQRVFKLGHFSTLGSIADIKIGVVTGANSFFIHPETFFDDLPIDKELLTRPVITNASELRAQFGSSAPPLPRLLALNKPAPSGLASFLSQGRHKQIHKRYYPRKRSPWYAVRVGETPDAFLPYRYHKSAHILLNPRKLQSTNSIHRIYFKRILSAAEMGWLELFTFTSYFQLSCLLFARDYGDSIKKIEPGSARGLLVFLAPQAPDPDVLLEVKHLHALGQTSKAHHIATEYFERVCGIPPDIAHDVSLFTAPLLSIDVNIPLATAKKNSAQPPSLASR